MHRCPKKIAFCALTLMALALIAVPASAPAQEDACAQGGVFIGNQSGLDMWYTRNGGPCTIWSRGHILNAKSEDTIVLYRDMTCQTEYCPRNLTYDFLKSLDTNQNCRVRMLPSCNPADM